MAYPRSEDDYIENDILPFLASNYGYPIHDSERVRIKSVPIFRPSGRRSGSSPDIVYYHNGEPVLLVEAKREHKSHEEALRGALVYLKNFPIDYKEYAPSGLPPKVLATTVGLEIKFYKWSIDYSKPIPDFLTEEISILSFENLLKYYGLEKGYKARALTPSEFKIDFFDELVSVFKGDLKEEKITPEVVKRVVYQIFNYLRYGDLFTGQYPYVQLNLQSQKAVRDLFNRFDFYSSLGPEIAKEFRRCVLRAFQGGGFNQYITENCIIAFMVNLLGELTPETKVLDFECGSGGFLAAVIDRGVKLENILGVDIDELPYIVAKTYLALYFRKIKEEIDLLPVRQDNGLFYYGENWDLVIGNPAGGNKYEHGNEEKILDGGLLNLTGKKHVYSEYELSIQQAVRSSKVGGRICLILPEGFFSNSKDEFLRKYVAKYCKVLAVISLPRGVFKKGTSVKQQQKGAQTSSQKMSILYLRKIKNIDKVNPVGEIDLNELEYPVFLASINEPNSKIGKIDQWLEPLFKAILEQWEEWQKSNQLKEINLIKIAYPKEEKPKELNLSLFDVEIENKPKIESRRKEPKLKTKISEFLEDLFK